MGVLTSSMVLVGHPVIRLINPCSSLNSTGFGFALADTGVIKPIR